MSASAVTITRCRAVKEPFKCRGLVPAEYGHEFRFKRQRFIEERLLGLHLL
jgi:hypothetical protein